MINPFIKNELSKFPKEYEFCGYLDLPKNDEYCATCSGWFLSKKRIQKVELYIDKTKIFEIKRNKIRKDVTYLYPYYGEIKRNGFEYTIPSSVINKFMNKRKMLFLRFYIDKSHYVDKYKTPVHFYSGGRKITLIQIIFQSVTLMFFDLLSRITGIISKLTGNPSSSKIKHAFTNNPFMIKKHIKKNEILILNSAEIPIKARNIYNLDTAINALKGSKFCAYLAVIVLDNKGKELNRYRQWINDFSGQNKEYSIKFTAPPKSATAVIGYRINFETPFKGEIEVKLPDISSLQLCETNIKEQTFLKSAKIHVKPGHKYSASSNPTFDKMKQYSICLAAVIYDLSGGEIAKYIKWIRDFPGKPKKCTVTFIAPAEAAMTSVGYIVDNDSPLINIGELNALGLDNIKIEEVDLPTLTSYDNIYEYNDFSINRLKYILISQFKSLFEDPMEFAFLSLFFLSKIITGLFRKHLVAIKAGQIEKKYPLIITNKKKMKILFVTAFLPSKKHGGGVVMLNLIKELSKYNDISLISFLDNEEEKKYIREIKPFLKKIKILARWERKDLLQIKPQLIPDTIWNEFFRPELIQEINKELSSDKYDIVQFDYLQTAIYRHLCKIPKTTIPVLVDHETAHKSWLQQIWFDSKLSLSTIIEYLRFFYFEISIINNFPKVIVFTNSDAVGLLRYSPSANLAINSLGVDFRYFLKKQIREDFPSLIFLGNYGHFPNREAAILLMRDIIPLVAKAFPKIKLYIVGHSVTKDLNELAKKNRHIILVGSVNDTRPYINKASIFVNPIRGGTGTRVKILEAMACEKAIVSTSLGCRGIEVENNKNILIEDNYKKFAEKICFLLKNRQFRDKLGKNARELVKKNHSWQSLAAQRQNIYLSLKSEEKP